MAANHEFVWVRCQTVSCSDNSHSVKEDNFHNYYPESGLRSLSENLPIVAALGSVKLPRIFASEPRTKLAFANELRCETCLWLFPLDTGEGLFCFRRQRLLQAADQRLIEDAARFGLLFNL